MIKAFGGTKIEGVAGPDGKTAHAEIKIGDSIVMVGGKENAEPNTSMIYLYVEDTDAVYNKALELDFGQ